MDGKIVVGGTFNTLGGQSCNQLGRVNADGTVDTGFNPGANSTVNSVAVQADGEILVGGYFTTLGGQSRNYIGRLTPTVPATQSLAFDGSTIIWLRGGSSPEVWRTSFEGSTNGSSWIPLGAGTRVAGGWQLSGLAWPTNAFLRARGFVAGGYLNGSGWFVETIASPPVFVTQPTSQTVTVGDTVTFNVSATGTPPLSYQWNFNGTNISGATNMTLTLTNVQLNQAGNYAVLVANAFGSILGSNAMLWVQIKYDFTYTTNNGTITISGYTGSGGSVAIPAIINGLPVTSIGSNAFYYCTSLTNVTIPSSVTSIGEFAFAGTGLTGVTIGNSVTNIGTGAFAYCSGLTAITVNTNNPAYGSLDGVLLDESQTTLIAYPNGKAGSYTIPNSVTSIGNLAFAGCGSLSSVTIPNSVTSIGDGAFFMCNSMVNVIIPNSVTSIGEWTFYGCNRLSSVTIGNSVTNIGNHAFSWCISLAEIYFQGNAPSMGSSVFDGDNNATADYLWGTTGWENFAQLTGLPTAPWNPDYTYTTDNGAITITGYIGSDGDVTIPSTINGLPVTSIGFGAFLSCASLTRATIPDSVTSIGDGAFLGCFSLTEVYFQGNAPSIGSDVFYGDNATIYYLPGTTGWGAWFGGCPTAPGYLPNPLILNGPSIGVQTNGFGFIISWATNISVVVEACTNFANPVWQPVQTNTLTDGWCYFSDPDWTNYSVRFYRLRSP